MEYHQLYDDICELPVNQELITRLRFPKYLQDSSAELGLQGLPRITDTSIIMRGPKGALEIAKGHFYRLQEEIDRETTLRLDEDVDQLGRIVNGPAWSDIVINCGGPSNTTLQRALVIL